MSGGPGEKATQPYEPYWLRGLRSANNAPRCGAKRRRREETCQAPAMPNGRCRLHGGASPGAPHGERNGNFRSGLWTSAAKSDRTEARSVRLALTRFINELLALEKKRRTFATTNL